MEGVEKAIEMVQRRRTLREEHFCNEERKQITEYSKLMNMLQTLKDERNNSKEIISKDLQSLTTHKHSIYKLIHNSENIVGLPISRDYHRQTIMFLTDAIDFINKSDNIYKNFDGNSKEGNITSTNLIHNITSCTKSIVSELYKIKSLITEVNELQKNSEILQEYHLETDKDMHI